MSKKNSKENKRRWSLLNKSERSKRMSDLAKRRWATEGPVGRKKNSRRLLRAKKARRIITT